MAYRKKTLRSMSPTTRKLARLIGELGSVERRLKNLIAEVQLIEGESQALRNQNRYKGKGPPPPKPDWEEVGEVCEAVHEGKPV